MHRDKVFLQFFCNFCRKSLQNLQKKFSLWSFFAGNFRGLSTWRPVFSGSLNNYSTKLHRLGALQKHSAMVETRPLSSNPAPSYSVPNKIVVFEESTSLKKHQNTIKTVNEWYRWIRNHIRSTSSPLSLNFDNIEKESTFVAGVSWS